MADPNSRISSSTLSPPPGINLPSRAILESDIQSEKTAIWAVGGGKGGIGKTLLASNMAIYLGWLNKKVVVVDMDLGGANLHTSLGVFNPTKTLADLLLGKTDDIRQVVLPTPQKNVRLISGAQDPSGIVNMRHLHRLHLAKKFEEIEADYIILDLGAGTALHTLEFFLMADEKIVITTPEPTSIENSYRFIKAAFYHALRHSTPSPYVRQLIEQAMDQKNKKGIRSPKDLLLEIGRLSQTDGAKLRDKMRDFHLSLVLNQVRVSSEADVGDSVELVCERYFGMSVEYVGYLPYDSSVWQSVRRRVPFLIEAPNSAAVSHLEAILRRILIKDRK